MPIISPHVPTRQEVWEERKWLENECYQLYVRERRSHCTFKELMDLWLRAPCCDECIQSEMFFEEGGPPDIMRENWELDTLLKLGPDTLKLIRSTSVSSPDCGPLCKLCQTVLQPWNGDDICILSYHLEEHYRIPDASTCFARPNGIANPPTSAFCACTIAWRERPWVRGTTLSPPPPTSSACETFHLILRRCSLDIHRHQVLTTDLAGRRVDTPSSRVHRTDCARRDRGNERIHDRACERTTNRRVPDSPSALGLFTSFRRARCCAKKSSRMA